MEHREKKIDPQALRRLLQSRSPLDLPWPSDAAGDPELPVRLINQGGNQMDFEMTAAMLRSLGIPILRIYPPGRLALQVVMGFTGGGMDIYVPASLLEDAQTLLAGKGEILKETEADDPACRSTGCDRQEPNE